MTLAGIAIASSGLDFPAGSLSTTANIGAIVGGAVGGGLFLFVIAIMQPFFLSFDRELSITIRLRSRNCSYWGSLNSGALQRLSAPTWKHHKHRFAPGKGGMQIVQ